MCFSTSVTYFCSSPTCPSNGTPYHQSTSIDACSNLSHIGSHMPWPAGCSDCLKPRPTKSSREHHTTPVDHFLTPEPEVQYTTGLCPRCTTSQEAPELETLSLAARSELYAQTLFPPPSQIPQKASRLASLLQPSFTSTGQSPHVAAAACVYAASHLCNAPIRLQPLLSRLGITPAYFSNTYSKILQSREDIFRAGILKYGEEWQKLPKACCFRDQGRACPRTKTHWGSYVTVCSREQEKNGVVGSKSDWTSFINFNRKLGDVLPGDLQKPPMEAIEEIRALRRGGSNLVPITNG